ncbi:hypothetical protein RRG08_061396 [Elysia crispata]|uniref:Cytochrome P450 n=1 Tax=Elysia crispata TaxID=231223 RepID=A0AAE1AFC2_9GAST|nr:hypothetical protein RRG08_061396 [Elysia crispata]
MDSGSVWNNEGWISKVLTLLAVSLGLAMLVKYVFTSNVPHNTPPVPARAYPGLGHLPYFRNGTREQLSKWTKSTGEIFSMYFGPKLVIALNSYDTIYEAFVKNGDTFSDRPKSLLTNASDGEMNRGLVTSSGHVWREQRKTALLILRSLSMGKYSLALRVSDEVRKSTD